MPQMSPMLWLNLFILFLISLVCFTVINYRYFILTPKKSSLLLKAGETEEKSWKWW